VLAHLRRRPDPPYHKFVVFSEIDKSDTVVPKYVQCDNCGVVHKIIDICKSEIITGKDEITTITDIDDLRLMIQDDVAGVLDSYNCDLATWENVYFIISNKKWGNHVILTRDSLNDEEQGKILRFIAPGQIKIEAFINRSILEEKK
jgi:hypothetical protein